MKVLIVEDEKAAGSRLVRMVREIRPHYQILTQLESVQNAVSYLSEQGCPDLIFMDIQLGDGLSFNIFNQIEVKCPIIFTTAFNQYALKAFKVNSIDYLLKPIDPQELALAIQKFEQLQFPATNFSPAMISSLIEAIQGQRYKDRFLVKAGKSLRYVTADQIAFFYSEDGLAFVLDRNGQRLMVDSTLESIESAVDPKKFFRINRKALVHIESIQRIHPHLNNRLKLDTDPGAPFDFIVAREKASSFKQWLDGS